MPYSALFESFLAEPVFTLTSDQDWAPDWALASLLEIAEEENIPLHLFATNASRVLGSTEAEVTLGIHPNFHMGSSHGDTEDEVIETCLELVPDACTFRCHSFYENTTVLRKLLARGLYADSNLLTFLQPQLCPLLHGTGILRFPVAFEDDVFLEWAAPDLDLTQVLDCLMAPGLKVLNFHPALVALNAPSVDYYNRMRSQLYDASGATVEPYDGVGARTVLIDVMRAVRAAGIAFRSFPSLVEEARLSIATTLPDGLYRWGKTSHSPDV